MTKTDYSVHGTFPIALAIETRTRWHPEDSSLDTEEIALVAYMGGQAERIELGVVEMSGYDASQRPEYAVEQLLKKLTGK